MNRIAAHNRRAFRRIAGWKRTHNEVAEAEAYRAEDTAEDETYIEYTLPWLKAVRTILRSLNFFCTHQWYCHPNCYKRQTRAARRLMEAVREI